MSDKDRIEIIESFKAGKSIEFLSSKFNCNKLTITRNLKKTEISNFKLNHRSKKATYLQGIVALTLDTGLIGMLLLGKLYLLNFIIMILDLV